MIGLPISPAMAEREAELTREIYAEVQRPLLLQDALDPDLLQVGID